MRAHAHEQCGATDGSIEINGAAIALAGLSLLCGHALGGTVLPSELLTAWESRWRKLSRDLRMRSLDRDEVREICRFPDREIRRALRYERKLASILATLDPERSRSRDGDQFEVDDEAPPRSWDHFGTTVAGPPPGWWQDPHALLDNDID